MTNKYRVLIYLSILSFLMCSKDNTLKIDNEINELEFMLQFGNEADGNNLFTRSDELEKAIKDISLLITPQNSTDQEVLEFIRFPYTGSSTNLDISRWETEGIIVLRHSSILNNLSRLRNVHLIINVDNEYFLYGRRPEDATIDSITSDITPPFVMYGYKEGHNFQEKSRLPITVTRNVAKVELTINTINDTITGKIIKLLPENQETTIYTTRVTDRAYLMPSAYNPPTTRYINYPAKTISPISRTQSTTSTFFSTYINENLLATYDIEGESNITSVILQIPYEYEGDIIEENYYKILINKENGYKINRNTIYSITANIHRLGGETPLEAPLIQGQLEIIEWNDNSFYSELTNTQLTVKETVCYMGLTKDFYFTTNASREDVSIDRTYTADWLTVELDENNINNIKLTADKDTYTEPRYTKFNIQVKNLKKTITVWQQPGESTGSISLSKDSLHLFEYRPSANVELTVTPNNADWEIWEGDLDIATMSPQNGSGTQTLTFGISQNYGNTILKIVNKETFEYAEIELVTYHLDCPDELEYGAQGGDYKVNITAYGGIEEWDLLGYGGQFISNLKKENNKLLISIDENTLNQELYGWVSICHATYRDYIKTIPITQSDFVGINIENVDHLVFGVNHEAFQRSLFAAWEVTSFGIPELEKTVGSNLTREDLYYYYGNDSIPFLWSPLNFTNNHGHTNWFYLCVESLKKIDSLIPNTLPQHIEFNLYACWAQGEHLSSTGGVAVPEIVYLDVIAYSGGSVVRKPLGSARKQEFISEGGSEVYNTVFNDLTIVYAQNGYHYNANGTPTNSSRCDRYNCRHNGLNVYAEIYDRLYPETYNKVAKVIVDWKKGGVKVQFEDSSQDWRPSCPSGTIELYQP